jgi:rhodanese-related sulfurtransferase
MKLILIFIVLIASVPGMAQKSRNLSVNEAETMLGSNKEIVIIDVRTNDEVKEYGMIAGARQIDYFAKDFEKQLLTLDKNQTYIVYCASGARSGEAAEILNKNGFKKIYNLPAGFNGWKKAKKPIARVNP